MPTVAREIMLANLDSTEQLRLRLDTGSAEVSERVLLSAFRTALLLADVIVIDRNQLLDGPFFTRMTPDRLAWHLGLEPGATLPLVVSCEPPPGRAPSGAGAGADEAPGAEELADVVDHQLQRVGDRAPAMSSALLAEGAVDLDADGRATPNVLSIGSTYLGADTRREATERVQRSRAAWGEAMRAGRVRLTLWGQGLEPEMGEALAWRGRRTEPGGLTDLLQGLRLAEGPDRVPTIRTQVVAWLNGTADVPGLARDDQAAAARDRSDFAVRLDALRWWNRAYYDAICRRDARQLLSFDPDDAVRSVRGRRAEAAAAGPRSVARRTPDRNLREHEIELGGDALRAMAAMSPGTYQELRLEHRGFGDVATTTDRRQVAELAWRIRTRSPGDAARTREVRRAALKAVVLACLAVAVALQEAHVLVPRGTVLTVVWWFLFVATIAPWNALVTWVDLHPWRLRSTLRVR